jgi:non-heme chloroperoxidase
MRSEEDSRRPCRIARMPTFISDDGVSLSYRVLGEGSQAVMLVHGWMASGAVFDPMIELMSLRGVRLLVPDLRGTGASLAARTGFTLERYARDVIALADHEKLGRFALVGHSMGGQIAQRVAAEVPGRVSGLALLCSVPASGMALPPDAAGLFRTSGGDAGKQGTILDLACKQLSAEDRARMVADAGAISPECIQAAFDAWTGGGFAERLSRILAPTLVLATDDPFLPPAFLAETVVTPIARARLVYLPGPGHYPQVERPKETTAIVSAFLAGAQG